MITTTATPKVLSGKLQTEEAVHFTKMCFEKQLKEQLPLTKVSAPAIVLQGTGINDDLNGIERPVSFPIKSMQERPAEVVQSLAKWKRLRLKEYELKPGQGIVTDMKALRPDEDLGKLHSIFVDQWDWEMAMEPEDRTLDFLKAQVIEIYRAIKETEKQVSLEYPWLQAVLPAEITFIHSEDLLEKYPELTPKERENMATKEFGAVFLIGIGGELAHGEIHDGRAPDYDDWSTQTSSRTKGLNGDILVWNPVLEQSFEISSMGIRVDPETLAQQLKIRKAESRAELYYHSQLLAGKLPQTIGGGIGQSRLCMFLLQKQHIGEVQAGIWSDDIREECDEKGISLL
ncbi:aspartate--ammonia ligase [Salinimicrobium gaetbulicola]|uniref:Aspartate--ammonia ligase n=1 Tax=Salinimicrobium gaetbulicola TaxID=999702 RepID=A0ABW3IEM0_9FLAO